MRYKLFPGDVGISTFFPIGLIRDSRLDKPVRYLPVFVAVLLSASCSSTFWTDTYTAPISMYGHNAKGLDDSSVAIIKFPAQLDTSAFIHSIDGQPVSTDENANLDGTSAPSLGYCRKGLRVAPGFHEIRVGAQQGSGPQTALGGLSVTTYEFPVTTVLCTVEKGKTYVLELNIRAQQGKLMYAPAIVEKSEQKK